MHEFCFESLVEPPTGHELVPASPLVQVKDVPEFPLYQLEPEKGVPSEDPDAMEQLSTPSVLAKSAAKVLQDEIV